MEFRTIHSVEDFTAALSQDQAALFYFSTPSCNVCKVLKPEVAGLMGTRFPEFRLYYTDIEKSPELAGQMRIFTIPVILVYFEGREHIRKIRNFSLFELEEEIRRIYEMLFN